MWQRYCLPKDNSHAKQATPYSIFRYGCSILMNWHIFSRSKWHNSFKMLEEADQHHDQVRQSSQKNFSFQSSAGFQGQSEKLNPFQSFPNGSFPLLLCVGVFFFIFFLICLVFCCSLFGMEFAVVFFSKLTRKIRNNGTI